VAKLGPAIDRRHVDPVPSDGPAEHVEGGLVLFGHDVGVVDVPPSGHGGVDTAAVGWVSTSTRAVSTVRPRVEASVGPPLRFHDLRHSHAAMLIASGEHPKVFQSRLGHTSIATTLNTYGHLIEGLDEAAADRLDAMRDEARAAQVRPNVVPLATQQ
jgi:hypothetical protein